MLIIRQRQLDALRSVTEEEFERRAAAYLRQTYPAQCEGLDAAAVRESVRVALRKRSEYEFDSEETVLLYLDLMYLLGFDFDTAPASSWVRQTLNDFDLAPRTRLVLLKEEAEAKRHV